VRAYQNNPQLNAQRASVRATDENVSQALSGYRPKVATTDSPRAVGMTVTQTFYNGNQTANKTRAAESQVSGAREGLRVHLLAAATVYMDYLRDSAIVEVNRNAASFGLANVVRRQDRQPEDPNLFARAERPRNCVVDRRETL
jgi:outer membrane protein